MRPLPVFRRGLATATASGSGGGVRLARFRCSEEGAVYWGALPAGHNAAAPGMKLPVHADADVACGQVSSSSTSSMRTVAEVLLPLPYQIPPAVVLVGLNYRAHADEVGHNLPRFPITLLANPASVTGGDYTGDRIVCPPCVSRSPPELDFEAELCLVVGRACKDVAPENALGYLSGVTCANDVSARRWQGKKGGGQWSRAKSFDSFTPVGPALLLAGKGGVDINRPLGISSRVNGVVMQSSSTSDMIFSPSELISFVSQGTTLLPGTLILTGTPAGVGYTREPPVWLRDGDEVECTVEDVGTISSTVHYA